MHAIPCLTQVEVAEIYGTLISWNTRVFLAGAPERRDPCCFDPLAPFLQYGKAEETSLLTLSDVPPAKVLATLHLDLVKALRPQIEILLSEVSTRPTIAGYRNALFSFHETPKPAALV